MRYLTCTLLAATMLSQRAFAETVDTVLVKGEDGKALRINEADYDKKVHKLFKADEDLTAANDPAAIQTAAVQIGMNDGAGALGASNLDKNVTLREATIVTETKLINADDNGAGGSIVPVQSVPEAQPKLFVSKTGSKYFVVGSDGQPVDMDGVDKAGYKTNDEAWTAVNALVGPASEPAPAAVPGSTAPAAPAS